MHAHIMGMIEEYGLIYTPVAKPAQAQAAIELQEVWIPRVKSEISYASCLHEIGHIRGRYGWSKHKMVRERDAWRWAKAHALIWTARMESDRQASLGWYEEQLKDGRMSKSGRFLPLANLPQQRT